MGNDKDQALEVREDSGQADFTGFSLKAGQAIWHHLEGSGGWGSQSDIKGDRILRMGGSGSVDLAEFVLKLDSAEINMDAQKSGPSWKESSGDPD